MSLTLSVSRLMGVAAGPVAGGGAGASVVVPALLLLGLRILLRLPRVSV